MIPRMGAQSVPVLFFKYYMHFAVLDPLLMIPLVPFSPYTILPKPTSSRESALITAHQRLFLLMT